MENEKRFVGDGFLCRRYGVTKQTIWRWRKDPRLNFPKPRKFAGATSPNKTDLAELDAFDVAMAGQGVK